MRELGAMWRNTRMVVLCAISAALYAAVLVPFLLGAEPGVLLTCRTTHLTSHAGQVSFPGGRIDPGDASAESHG